MKKILIILIFVSTLNNISFGQNSDNWKKIIHYSNTFKVKRDKYKIPTKIINRLFDTISSVKNPKENVHERIYTRLKWFAVDEEEHYIIFVTCYGGYRNRNLCFLVTNNNDDQPIVVENIIDELDFKEFKMLFINKDIKIDYWPDK